jgi:hypothetical protein
MPNLTIQPAAVVVTGSVQRLQSGPGARSLYVIENKGMEALFAGLTPYSRGLYLVENEGVQALSVAARSLYAIEDKGIQALSVVARAVYVVEETRDLPVQPWLLKLDPGAQYPLGAVDLYGDGLGQFTEVAAGSTITASSTNGGNVPGNTVIRTSALNQWKSNDGNTAWIRFTFGSPQTIYGVALEDTIYDAVNAWGTPLFRFSDGGADVVGGSGVPQPTAFYRPTEYPVGAVRTLYVLPTERTGITWIEVRVYLTSGGGTNRGLSQVWVLADQGQNAEASVALLNALSMGTTGPWLNRSPNWWPANSGVPVAKAVTVIVPSTGVSGLVKVQES